MHNWYTFFAVGHGDTTLFGPCLAGIALALLLHQWLEARWYGGDDGGSKEQGG